MKLLYKDLLREYGFVANSDKIDEHTEVITIQQSQFLTEPVGVL